MRMHKERACAARQIAEIRQLQLRKAQAAESSARMTAQRGRAAHEQAMTEERECRSGHVHALDAGSRVDVAVLQQWMHMATVAAQKVANLAGECAQAEAALLQASSTVRVSEQRLDGARELLRRATRRLQKKVDEKKLESIELLTGRHGP